MPVDVFLLVGKQDVGVEAVVGLHLEVDEHEVREEQDHGRRAGDVEGFAGEGVAVFGGKGGGEDGGDDEAHCEQSA